MDERFNHYGTVERTSESPSHLSPDSRPALRAVDMPLTREAKARAAKKANRIARLLMIAGIGAAVAAHSLAGFVGVGVVTVIVNLAAWRYYLNIEREAAAREWALYARSLDEE